MAKHAQIANWLTDMANKQRGGARDGAGRPKLNANDKAKNRTIRMTDDDWQKFKLLGGAKWLINMLQPNKKSL